MVSERKWKLLVLVELPVISVVPRHGMSVVVVKHSISEFCPYRTLERRRISIELKGRRKKECKIAVSPTSVHNTQP